MPFVPPQPQAEEAVTREPVRIEREWDPSTFLLCSHCGDPIKHGDQCIEILPGESGFGAKSGRPTVVDCAQSDFERAVLHVGCVYDYVFNVEETLAYEDEPRFCAGCEAKLDGEDG
jgi:hypothetical protein